MPPDSSTGGSFALYRSTVSAVYTYVDSYVGKPRSRESGGPTGGRTPRRRREADVRDSEPPCVALRLSIPALTISLLTLSTLSSPVSPFRATLSLPPPALRTPPPPLRATFVLSSVPQLADPRA